MHRRRMLGGAGLGVALAAWLGVSGAAPPATSGPPSLSIDNAARSSIPNVQIVGLYGAVGSGNVLLVNDQDQGYNANAQIPITAPTGEKAEVITGAFQTILPNGQVHDITIPRPLQGHYVAGSTTQTASLMSWDGVLQQVDLVESRAGRTPIVVNGNLTLDAGGSITITSASGTARFDQTNWQDPGNPLRQVLTWEGSRFRLDLAAHDTITINGYHIPGATGAESRGLVIREDLSYSGVGAIVVNVASGQAHRGIFVEGEEKQVGADGTVQPLGRTVRVLASQEGDGLSLVTNGRIGITQEGAHAPVVQGFLYAQGYRDASGQPQAIDIVGGNLEGMAVGSRVRIASVDGNSGIVTDRITIGGAQSTLTIPPQMPGGRPVYTATISNWRESR